ncbi:MAG TPA: hypothetical protein VNO70_02665 [Blastocatellia bacterium]|nr:hypothetical protein [Blastocatellia bacterium]
MKSKGPETLALAYRQADLFKNHLVAVVSRSLYYGIASQIVTLTRLRGGTLQVFYDREEARRWLRARLA